MTPYYADDAVTLWHGDCREVGDWLTADVLVTDPPYGTQLTSTANSNPGGYGRRDPLVPGRQSATILGDNDTASRDHVLSKWGTLRPVVVFGSPRRPEPPGDWQDRIVWDKKRPGTNGGAVRYMHEMVYARGLVRVDNATFSIISAHPDQRDHIHAKPHALMVRLLRLTPPGIIADPFAGSGSTLVAAKQLGRKAVGVEIDERYCEIAARRLSQDVLDFDDAGDYSETVSAATVNSIAAMTGLVTATAFRTPFEDDEPAALAATEDQP